MSASPIFKPWDYTLKIRHLFQAADSLPTAEETAQIAKNVIAAVRALQAKIPQSSPLWHDLDNCCESFDAVEGIDNAYEARDVLNSALAELYDEADFHKRVWVE